MKLLKTKTLLPNDNRLSWCGRVDWKDEASPVMVFPATSVTVRFRLKSSTASGLRVHLSNRNGYWDNYMGVLVDGRQKSIRIVRDGECVLDVEIPLPPNTPCGANIETEHTFTLFKRQDSCHEVTLLSIELPDDAELLPPPPKPARRIEVFGDSVSAGEVCEAVYYEGVTDPVHFGEPSNSYFAFPWVTARKLCAELRDIAQGGIALQDGNGWYGTTDKWGMLTMWDTQHYAPKFGGVVKYDLMQWTPDAAVVAIAQNDSYPHDFMAEDYDGAQAAKWREDYAELLRRIRGAYPDALIVCITTLLRHSPLWDKAIGQAVEGMGDKRIVQYLFRRNGAATDGHPRITEQEEMAGELAAFIAKKMGWEY